MIMCYGYKNLKDTVYALDASTIDLCLSLFSWARLRAIKAGVKLHALLDLSGNILSFVDITDAKVHLRTFRLFLLKHIWSFLSKISSNCQNRNDTKN